MTKKPKKTKKQKTDLIMTFNLNKICLEDEIILKERNELIVTLTVIFQSFNLNWLDFNTPLVQGTQ